jgi:hypothetical protein
MVQLDTRIQAARKRIIAKRRRQLIKDKRVFLIMIERLSREDFSGGENLYFEADPTNMSAEFETGEGRVFKYVLVPPNFVNNGKTNIQISTTEYATLRRRIKEGRGLHVCGN